MSNRLIALARRLSIAAATAGLGIAALPGKAAADDHVDVGFNSEPGDPAFGFVPSSVSPAEVIMVLIDRSGPLTSGVVLLTGGRSVAFTGVESRPFAITQAYVPVLVTLAEK